MTGAGLPKIKLVFEVPQGFVVDAALVSQTDGAPPFQLKQVAGDSNRS
jgi:hypothetical protein